jgi:hypothetical protein
VLNLFVRRALPHFISFNDHRSVFQYGRTKTNRSIQSGDRRGRMTDPAPTDRLPDDVLALFLAETRRKPEPRKEDVHKVELPPHLQVIDPKSVARRRRENARKELATLIDRPELRRSQVKSLVVFGSADAHQPPPP